jgi:hypothetical protein
MPELRQPYRSLKTKMLPARTSVIPFDTINGASPKRTPYASQRTIPSKSTTNVPSEMSAVERVFQVFTTCGRKATVVQNAAANPRNVGLSIVAALLPSDDPLTQEITTLCQQA